MFSLKFFATCVLVTFTFVIETYGIILPYDSKFYPDRLLSIEDCNLFLHSPSNAARGVIYTDKSQKDIFYLDSAFKEPLTTCFYSTADQAEMRYVITEFRGLTAIDDDMWTYYKNLSYVTRQWITLIPHFDVMVGPGGSASDVFTRTPSESFYDMWIVVAASEKEDIAGAYGTDFADQLEKKLMPFGLGSNRMIQFNGWHLSNMKAPINWPNLKHFAVIIITVEKEFSIKFQKKKALSKLPAEIANYTVFDIQQAKHVTESASNRVLLYPFLFLATVLALF